MSKKGAKQDIDLITFRAHQLCEIIAEGVIFIRNWTILTRAAFGIPHQKLFRVSGKDPAWCDNSNNSVSH